MSKTGTHILDCLKHNILINQIEFVWEIDLKTSDVRLRFSWSKRLRVAWMMVVAPSGVPTTSWKGARRASISLCTLRMPNSPVNRDWLLHRRAHIIGELASTMRLMSFFMCGMVKVRGTSKIYAKLNKVRFKSIRFISRASFEPACPFKNSVVIKWTGRETDLWGFSCDFSTSWRQVLKEYAMRV